MSYTLSDIRTYFNTAILAIDPNLKAWDQDPFGIDDVNDFQAETFYKLYFGTIDLERDGDHYIESIDTTLEIYAPRSRNELDNFDSVLQKAIDIKDCIVNPATNKASGLFTEIFGTTIEPNPLGEDDKSVKIVLSFDVRRLKKY